MRSRAVVSWCCWMWSSNARGRVRRGSVAAGKNGCRPQHRERVGSEDCREAENPRIASPELEYPASPWAERHSIQDNRRSGEGSPGRCRATNRRAPELSDSKARGARPALTKSAAVANGTHLLRSSEVRGEDTDAEAAVRSPADPRSESPGSARRGCLRRCSRDSLSRPSAAESSPPSSSAHPSDS